MRFWWVCCIAAAAAFGVQTGAASGAHAGALGTPALEGKVQHCPADNNTECHSDKSRAELTSSKARRQRAQDCRAEAQKMPHLWGLARHKFLTRCAKRNASG